MPRYLYMYHKMSNYNQWQILFLFISAKLRYLDPTLLYGIDSDVTTLFIGGKRLGSIGANKFGILDGKANIRARQNPQLKSMSNTDCVHVCKIKVFKLYFVNCIDSDWTTLSIVGKNWGPLDWPNLSCSMVIMHGKIPI